MNDTIKHIKPKVLHFRRWSNTSFAIFTSLGKVVHIGFLSTIIQRLITVKALIFHGLINIVDGINENDEYDEESIKQLEIPDISLADLLPNLIAPSIAVRVESFNLEFASTVVYINNIKASFGPFLFCWNFSLKRKSGFLFPIIHTNPKY